MGRVAAVKIDRDSAESLMRALHYFNLHASQKEKDDVGWIGDYILAVAREFGFSPDATWPLVEGKPIPDGAYLYMQNDDGTWRRVDDD